MNDSAFPGMSLRDYLAAKAMEAIIVNHVRVGQGWIADDNFTMKEIAKNSYMMSDEMLAERSKTKPHNLKERKTW